jgi:ribosome-binding protein aMBF1 (putative translation factor)
MMDARAEGCPGTAWSDLRQRRMAEPGAPAAYRIAAQAYELGGNLRKLREHQGLSQSQLARATGLTQSAVARAEAGGGSPTLPVLDRLAQVLAAELVVRLDAKDHSGQGDPART